MDTRPDSVASEVRGASANPLSPSVVTWSPGHLVTWSPWRAWCYLVWLCLWRQARARQMVWIALALVGFTATVIALVSAAGDWGQGKRKWVVEIPQQRYPGSSELHGSQLIGPMEPRILVLT